MFHGVSRYVPWGFPGMFHGVRFQNSQIKHTTCVLLVHSWCPDLLEKRNGGWHESWTTEILRKAVKVSNFCRSLDFRWPKSKIIHCILPCGTLSKVNFTFSLRILFVAYDQ